MEQKIWIWKGDKFKGAPHIQNAPLSFPTEFHNRKTSPSLSILTPQNTQLEISEAKTSSKKRFSESLVTKSASKFRVEDEFDPDLSRSIFKTSLVIFYCVFEEIYWNWKCDLNCSDIKGIMSELQQIRKKAQRTVKRRTNRRFLGHCSLMSFLVRYESVFLFSF